MTDKTLLKQLLSDDETAQDSALRNLALPTPADDLLKRVGALFQQRNQRAPERVTMAADLQFDSWAHGLPVGVRGAVLERQLLYEAGDYDLDVQVIPVGEAHLTLHGQLLTIDETATLEGLQIQLSADNDLAQDRIADSLGRFTFSTLPLADYMLTVFLPTHDVQFALRRQ